MTVKDWTFEKIILMNELHNRSKQLSNGNPFEYAKTHIACCDCPFKPDCDDNFGGECEDFLEECYFEYTNFLFKEYKEHHKNATPKEVATVYVCIEGNVEKAIKITKEQQKLLDYLIDANYFDNDVNFVNPVAPTTDDLT